MELLFHMTFAIGGLVTGLLLHVVWHKIVQNNGLDTAASIIQTAKQEAEILLKETDLATHNQIVQEKDALEKEIAAAKKDLRESEQRISRRDENLNFRVLQLEKRDQQLRHLKEQLDIAKERVQKRLADLEEAIQSQTQLLQEISGFTKEQAVAMLVKNVEEEVATETARLIEKSMTSARTEASKKAREILALAIQRCAVEHVVENVVCSLEIPGEEMKGRIIGREGRNIRTFQKMTGVDLIIDETPGIITISGFDPIRREIARRAMEKLIADGRIHPARIEEIVELTRQEMDEIILETGRQAAVKENISNLHPRILPLLGKLRFHSVMGQNLLDHTLEIVHLASLLAAEIGLDITLTKRCALLHDIGRSLDHNHEGSHAAAGAEIANKCEEPLELVNAIAAHHEEVPAQSLYAIVLQIAHKIALDRPGTRKEGWDRYLKRLERMEDLALSFPGVEKAYALQAGREIRCVVNCSEVDDSKAVRICRGIAKRIGQESNFPGEVKVVIVRETRIIEYAR